MLGLGKLVHLAFDAVLVATVLAGVQRTTGLTPAIGKINSKDLRNIVASYLEVGEWVLDFAVVFMGRSSAFERKRS